VCLLETETGRADESLVLRWLSDEVFGNESNLIDQALPSLILAFTGAHDLEHLIFAQGFDFSDRDGPLAGLLLSLLFDHVGQNLGPVHLISVKQIGRDCALFRVLGCAHLSILLFVSLDRLLHLGLLLVLLLGVKLSLDTVEHLGFLGGLVNRTGFLLTFLLSGVHAGTEALLKELHVIVLWLIRSARLERIACGDVTYHLDIIWSVTRINNPI